jgi:predicted ribosome quality control (RQC) complex YloA/Tae2 family protein
MNTTFKVGRNAAENWKLIQAANQSYYWLHMDGGQPSSHIIIEIDCEPTPAELRHAAKLCIAQTKTSCKNFVWTQIKDVKLGSKTGEVILKSRKIFRL